MPYHLSTHIKQILIVAIAMMMLIAYQATNHIKGNPQPYHHTVAFSPSHLASVAYQSTAKEIPSVIVANIAEQPMNFQISPLVFTRFVPESDRLPTQADYFMRELPFIDKTIDKQIFN